MACLEQVSTLRKHGTLETMVPSATRDLHLVTYQHPSLSDPGWVRRGSPESVVSVAEHFPELLGLETSDVESGNRLPGEVAPLSRR